MLSTREGVDVLQDIETIAWVEPDGSKHVWNGRRGDSSPIKLEIDHVGDLYLQHCGDAGEKLWIFHNGEWHLMGFAALDASAMDRPASL